MSIRPEYISIGDLFGRNFIFRVPRYQRGYAWEDAEVDDFLRDLTTCYNARIDGESREHFFGGIVAVERVVTGSAGHHCDLIDGQQRVATFVLLASCLAKHFHNIANAAKAAGDSANQELALARSAAISAMYLEFADEINRQPVTVNRLELSDPDQPFFLGLLTSTTMPDCPGNEDRKSHARLWRAYDKLYRDLQDAIDASPSFEGQLEALAIVRDILLHDATVINIVTDHKAEAYRLFQVLNNRGTKLTEGDLLRASTLEMLGMPGLEQEHERAATLWDEILKYDPAYTQDFLGWYYASVQGERAGQSSLFDEFVDAFFPQYASSPVSKSQAKDVVRTINAIQNNNALCRGLLEGGWPYNDGKAKRWDMDRLQVLVGTLNHTACIPLLLAATTLDEKAFIEVVSLTERFSFRFKSICNLHIGSLQKVYHAHAIRIRSDPKTYKVSTLRSAFRKLQDDKATDSLFTASLAQALSYQPSSGNKLLKYFLSTIEHFWRWFEDGASGSPKCKDPTRVFDLGAMTVEHLYPRSPKAKDRQTTLDPLVNKLGNLTLLGEGDNDAVGNKPFSEKQPILARSSLRLNQVVAQNAQWGKKEIRDREAKLIEVALRVFAM